MNDTIDQLALFDEPSALEQDFWAFHNRNRHVYALLVGLARDWTRRTRQKLGIKALFERARWEVGVKTDGVQFELNNNHTAFYARLIMRNEADLRGLFNIRNQRIQSTL